MAGPEDPTAGRDQEFLLPEGTVDLQPTYSEARQELPGPRRELSKASLPTRAVQEEQRRKHVGSNIVPGMLKSILLQHHGIQNWKYIHKKHHVCSGSKQIYIRMTKHHPDDIEHSRKKRPLCGKDLVLLAQLAH